MSLPRTPEERMESKVQFYKMARFPKVIGAIDCTHIKLLSPTMEHVEKFRNREGYLSLKVQALVNANLEFMHISFMPGLTDDNKIFKRSGLKEIMENQDLPDCVILGDADYAVSPYLLTPLANPSTIGERLYNDSHIRTRYVIERTFGIWKQRFPVLSSGMQLDMEKIILVIQSCAILHNIARKQNDSQPPDDIGNVHTLNETIETTQQQNDRSMQSQRDALILGHFSNM